MSFSLVYLVQRLFYRIYDFIRDWYVGGFRWFSHRSLNVLERLDRLFAFKVTLRYWFKPLYQDYTFIGYVLGFIFRTVRLLAAGLVYLTFAVISWALYLAWAAIPIYLVYRIIYGK